MAFAATIISDDNHFLDGDLYWDRSNPLSLDMCICHWMISAPRHYWRQVDFFCHAWVQPGDGLPLTADFASSCSRCHRDSVVHAQNKYCIRFIWLAKLTRHSSINERVHYSAAPSSALIYSMATFACFEVIAEVCCLILKYCTPEPMSLRDGY